MNTQSRIGPSLHQIEESELIKQLKQKNPYALSYLYNHYAVALYDIIHRIVKIDEVSEEVLQDSFVKIWNKIHYFDPNKGKLFTWMFNIARNQSIDKLRSKEYSQTIKMRVLDESVFNNKFHVFIEQQIVDTALINVLGQLTIKHWIILYYHFFEDYSYGKIAEEFDIPEGTVKTRARTALIKLRTLLNKSHIDTNYN